MYTWFRKTLNKQNENDKGFTLIELLVVIIIIGILAAIAIPVFLNQRTSAWKASVVTDVHNATLAVETYGTANNGSFTGLLATEKHVGPGGTGATASPVLSFVVTKGNTVTVNKVSGTEYNIVGTNENLTGTGNTYTYGSASGAGSWA